MEIPKDNDSMTVKGLYNYFVAIYAALPDQL